MSDKVKKLATLSMDIPLTDKNLVVDLDEQPSKLSADISEVNDPLSTSLSTLMSGVTDVLVNGESVVENSVAYVNVATAKYVDEKVAEEKAERVAEDTLIRQEMSIIRNDVQEMSIIVKGHTEQLSTLHNKINEVDLRLSSTKLDKNLSILQDAKPNELSIESRDNLLVYLYNASENGEALKAKLTELGYWDELKDANTAK